jgi:hypothetical protein
VTTRQRDSLTGIRPGPVCIKRHAEEKVVAGCLQRVSRSRRLKHMELGSVPRGLCINFGESTVWLAPMI